MSLPAWQRLVLRMVSRPGRCRLVFLRRRGWTGRTEDGGDRGGRHLSVSRARGYRRIMLKRKIELPPEHLYPADEWRIVETRYSDEFVGLTETVFSLGNGFVGVRGSFEEGRPALVPGTFVNGFHETWPITHAEGAHALARTGQTIVNVPDTTILKLYVDDEPLFLPTARGGITTVRLPASVLGPASKAARLFSSARRQSRVRRRPGRRRARLSGPARRPARHAGRRARPPAVLGRIVRYLARGTRTGSSPTSHRHPQGRQRARGRAAGGAGVPAWCTWTGTRSCPPHGNRLRGAPQGTTAYIYGELSSARILPRASRSRSRPAFRRPGPSAVSLRHPARLPKTRAASFEAGERAVVIAQEHGPGGRQAPHTEAQARAWCARCRGCSRGRCGRRRRSLSGRCSGSTSGSTGPGRPRRARRPGRGSRCRTGSRPGPGTRPSRGSRRGPAGWRRGLRRRRRLR